LCHYCDHAEKVPSVCPKCHSEHIHFLGFGSEKVEDELHQHFPRARIARMDRDTVSGKRHFETILSGFRERNFDILVGTQMVVKGLDFDQVELVGILDADSLLHFADFRVNERAFQLMEQVSGRAGRKDGTGKVLIQTINPGHPILMHVSRHDYTGMYMEEIEKRKQFFYPPFSRIINIHFRHKEKDIVTEAAHTFANALEVPYEKFIVGPAEPVISRVRNLYLMELLLKLSKETQIICKCKSHLLK